MPPKKKRKTDTADPPSIIVSDIFIRVVPQKLKGGGKECDRSPSDFRVHYTLVLSDKCCHSGGKKISVTSNQSLWAKTDNGTDQDHAILMKALTEATLQRHKEQATSNGVECRLDYASAGALPKTDMMWRYLWAYAENEIRKAIMSRKAKSDSVKQGHKNRATKIIGREWEKGADFDNKYARFRARKAVVDALMLTSGKSTFRAADIWYYAAMKLKEASAKLK